MKLSERMKWIFAILFLLCGVSSFFLDKHNSDPATAHILAGIASLFLSGFTLCLAWSALETDEIKLQHFQYRRRSQPRRFMATIALILIAGCGTLVTSFWFLFFK
jgi:hypothetical protein